MSNKKHMGWAVCLAEDEGAVRYDISGYGPARDGEVFVRPAVLTPEAAAEAAAYRIAEKLGGMLAEERARELRPEEVVQRDGHFWAALVRYRESEDYNDRTWEVTRAELLSRLILLPGRGFVETDDGCYGGTIEPLYSRLMRPED